MVSLWSYDWPGNVRELENMIERLVIMCEGEVIDAELLPPNLVATTRASENHVPVTLAEGGVNLNAMVRELEGRMINEALHADRRQQAGRGPAAGAQADDLFSQAAALRRDCAGRFRLER